MPRSFSESNPAELSEAEEIAEAVWSEVGLSSKQAVVLAALRVIMDRNDKLNRMPKESPLVTALFEVLKEDETFGTPFIVRKVRKYMDKIISYDRVYQTLVHLHSQGWVVRHGENRGPVAIRWSKAKVRNS